MAKHTTHLRSAGAFGLAIQQARLEQGLSQNELAEIVDVPQSTISQIENGTSTIFLRRILAIAKATGLEFTASWGSDDEAER